VTTPDPEPSAADRARSLVDSVVVGQPTTDEQALAAAGVYATLALAESVDRLRGYLQLSGVLERR